MGFYIFYPCAEYFSRVSKIRIKDDVLGVKFYSIVWTELAKNWTKLTEEPS